MDRKANSGVKFFLKKIPLFVRMKRAMWSWFDKSVGKSSINVTKEFSIYVPAIGGNYQEKAWHTIQSINQCIPFLNSLASTLYHRKLTIKDITEFAISSDEKRSAADLKVLFDKYGSDKSTVHNYHYVYGPILLRANEVKNVFEVGLGTNNPNIAANMGLAGKPGASLRAFREYLPHAKIYGADIDKSILFSEERIETHYVDQTNPATFEVIRKIVPEDFDLIIDDGLHGPNANILTLQFGLSKIKKGGWVVIEDIGGNSIPVWELVAAILPASFESSFLKAEGGTFVFAVKKID